ncbi:MAG TPA: hypothetical protein VKZ85_13370 [Woeseiaceae bacterium]|nr:hypothetical protein [Woeseiaceae bacterium]
MQDGHEQGTLLSSERIRARFGSYGVEVLAADHEQRVSNLYSLSGGRRICRSYAEVRFLLPVPPELAREHARVLAGASIGATFKAAGWRIERRHLHVGETRLGPGEHAIAGLMGIDPDTPLATHGYVFHVSRDDRGHDYARILERHHPDYLDAAEIAAIYGLAGPGAGRSVA